MKGKVVFGLVLALVAALTVVPSLQAGMNSGGLSLAVTGPISVVHGQTLKLTVIGNCTLAPDPNTGAPQSIDWASMQVVVINPWTGAVISGPTTINVNQNLTGHGWDQSYNFIPAVPSTPVSVPMAIAKSQKAGQTLSAVIYGMDNNSKVIGITGWGFVTQ